MDIDILAIGVHVGLHAKGRLVAFIVKVDVDETLCAKFSGTIETDDVAIDKGFVAVEANDL